MSFLVKTPLAFLMRLAFETRATHFKVSTTHFLITFFFSPCRSRNYDSSFFPGSNHWLKSFCVKSIGERLMLFKYWLTSSDLSVIEGRKQNNSEWPDWDSNSPDSINSLWWLKSVLVFFIKAIIQNISFWSLLTTMNPVAL